MPSCSPPKLAHGANPKRESWPRTNFAPGGGESSFTLVSLGGGGELGMVGCGMVGAPHMRRTFMTPIDGGWF